MRENEFVCYPICYPPCDPIPNNGNYLPESFILDPKPDGWDKRADRGKVRDVTFIDQSGHTEPIMTKHYLG